MCDVPPRQWREAFSPARLLAGLGAVVLLGWGCFKADGTSQTVLLGLGAAFLIYACVGAIQQVEFSMPNVKVATAVRSRSEVLRDKLKELQPELEWCATRLCSDPDTATELLSVSMSRVTSAWRGPVGDGVRVYVLCWFVHRLVAHHRTQALLPVTAPRTDILPVPDLTLNQRIAVVLSEGAELTADQIASMLGVSTAEVNADLTQATFLLKQAARPGGQWL